MPSQEVVEVVLVLVLFTFTPNKSFAYFLNVESYNSVVLKSYNTELDKIIITFTNQNQCQINLTLLINK